jgi:hypothetical protein
VLRSDLGHCRQIAFPLAVAAFAVSRAAAQPRAIEILSAVGASDATVAIDDSGLQPGLLDARIAGRAPKPLIPASRPPGTTDTRVSFF